MRPFAQEIIDMFIGHLGDDKQSLASSSLVSKTWLPRSRAHLFQSIRLTDESKVEPFTEFLADTPHIHPLIKDLTLRGQDKADHGGIGWLYIGIKTLAKILSYIPELRSLTLDTVQFSSQEDAPASCDRPVGLDRLVMRRTSAQSDLDDPYDPRPVVELLGLFSKVKTLDVDKMYIGEDIEEFTSKELITESIAALPEPPALKVQSLKLRRLSQLPPLFWFEYLQRSPSQDTLTSLSVHADVVDDLTSLGSLIRKSGGTLTTLALDFTRCVMPGVADSIPKHIDISCCKVLQSIHIATGPTSMATFTKVLRGLPASLRNVTVEFEIALSPISWAKSFPKLDWKNTEASWLALPNLAGVTFVLQCQPKTGFTSYQKNVIQGQFAVLDQKGVLHFGLEGFHSVAEEDEDEEGDEEGSGEEDEDDE